MSSLADRIQYMLTAKSGVDWRKVQSIAKTARVVVVNFQETLQERADRKYYPRYNEQLESWCALSATFLYRQLTKAGINCTLVMGIYDKERNGPYPNHVWVQVQNKIVDITATQFSTKKHILEPVHIVSVGDPMYIAKKSGPLVVKRELSKWPNEQIPTVHKIAQLMTHKLAKVK